MVISKYTLKTFDKIKCKIITSNFKLKLKKKKVLATENILWKMHLQKPKDHNNDKSWKLYATKNETIKSSITAI